jgi:hypothetical protein
MGSIHFVSAGDADELHKALEAEGYVVRLREGEGGRWLLDVEPFDDHVVAMVDVYGGWLPEEDP